MNVSVGEHIQCDLPYLLVQICLQIIAFLVPYFDMINVKGVHNPLNSLRFVSWRSCEGKYAEVWVLCHHVSDNLSIGVVTRCSMGLV